MIMLIIRALMIMFLDVRTKTSVMFVFMIMIMIMIVMSLVGTRLKQSVEAKIFSRHYKGTISESETLHIDAVGHLNGS